MCVCLRAFCISFLPPSSPSLPPSFPLSLHPPSLHPSLSLYIVFHTPPATPHHHLLADHASPSRPHAALSREPNLNDVVDFLSSGDAGKFRTPHTLYTCEYYTYIHLYIYMYVLYTILYVCIIMCTCVGLVANAASYLQHLAYGDDSMKAKIRYRVLIFALFSDT